MEQHNGHFNNSSFRDSYSIDGSSLIALSVEPAKELMLAMSYNNVAAPKLLLNSWRVETKSLLNNIVEISDCLSCFIQGISLHTFMVKTMA